MANVGWIYDWDGNVWDEESDLAIIPSIGDDICWLHDTDNDDSALTARVVGRTYHTWDDSWDLSVKDVRTA